MPKRLLRSIISPGPEISGNKLGEGLCMEHLTENLRKLGEWMSKGLEWELPEDRAIFAFVKDFAEENREVPDFQTVVDHFEGNPWEKDPSPTYDHVEITERLKIVSAAHWHIRTNFTHLIKQIHEKQYKFAISEANKLAHQINTKKVKIDGGRELSGPRDSAAFLKQRLDQLRARFEPVEKSAQGLPDDMSLGDLMDHWDREGPMVHEPTGIPSLDLLTGGGPVYGSRWFVLGSPDAGKTGFLVAQIVHEWAKRGIAVGVMAADEDPSDILTRIHQRCGFSREMCEQRDPNIMGGMRIVPEGLPVRIFRKSITIEEAARRLVKFAKESGHPGLAKTPEGKRPKMVLVVDSIQKVKCDATAGKSTPIREAISANAQAAYDVATQHGLFFIATSEVARDFYKDPESSRKLNALAAGKESGDLEFAARVQIFLNSVEGQPDLIEAQINKNKHGPSFPGCEDAQFFLKIDRKRQSFKEVPKDDQVVQIVQAQVDSQAKVIKVEREFLVETVNNWHKSNGTGIRRKHLCAELPKLKARGIKVGSHIVSLGKDSWQPHMVALIESGHVVDRPSPAGKGKEPTSEWFPGPRAGEPIPEVGMTNPMETSRPSVDDDLDLSL